MTTPNICDILKQNQRLFQIQNPPTRFEPLNPYLSSLNPKTNKPFTAFDFNMRRKTEILKYAPNKQSSQTNSLTKSQKWGQIVNGNFQTQSYTTINDINAKLAYIDGQLKIIEKKTTYLNGQKVDKSAPYIKVPTCPPARSQLTSSTACDIPGPPIYLYEDDSVPLYNYVKNTNSYALQNKVTSPNWYIESYSNITSAITIQSADITSSYLTTSYTIPATIATLYIVSPKYAVSTFNMNIPFGFYLAGKVSNNQSYMTNANTPILMGLSNPQLTVYVNNTPIILSAQPIYQYTWKISPINKFDIGVNIPASSTNTTYSIGQYVGSLQISNIVLPTSSGNVYDFKLSYMLDISNIDVSSYKSSIDNTVAGIISNITGNLRSNNAVSSKNTYVPVIPSTTSYASIQNPTNGFAFLEN